MIATLLAASMQATADYRVEPLAIDARVADVIGPKRSGSLCLPAGSIAWREARPDPADAREAFATGLRVGGIGAGDTGNPFSESGRGATRAIRASLRGVRLSACVPPGGLGRLLNRGQSVKGDGVMAVTWRVYARSQDAPILTGATCVTFAYRQERATLPSMTLAGFEAAGRQVAADVLAEGRLKDEEEANCRRLAARPGATFVVTGDD
ncbi:hypothetical protein [Sphingomonas bacterium]|uniref:hypothetical protein n=1 Tax=Sphingomonas bacterium TaxID=1895847 RepID=UPI0015752041|nr:hypothetical protein [Sphingomonas bacterium]